MTIKLIRLATGLSQKEFSLMYNIPLKTLQNWESSPSSSSFRDCPGYVLFLLEKAVKQDFPSTKGILETTIDERHLQAIRHAKKMIAKSPLSQFVADVFLYGSTARGQAKINSDIDILLVLDEKAKEKKKCNDWITYLKGNISSDDFNSPETDLHVVFEKNWKENNEAYFMNVKEEGFSIWN